MRYYIRAEITGEFVNKYEFTNKEKANQKYNELHNKFIYDELEMWES